jgi:monovalent cation:H+ antiporter-2, CPA2 family
MPHETSLIATVVVGLVLALGCGFLASRLHLPPLVGYLLAGVAVGPFTPGFVADVDLAGQLAEIGVILLMFGVGLHFSIADLRAVYPIALPGALAQIAVSVAAGAALAVLWGWGLGAGLLLGLALSVASTVVLLRVLEERAALDGVDGRIAIGWLIVQDLAMVLVLVLLPALAGSPGGHPGELAAHVPGGGLATALALTLGKVAAFIVLVLVVGKRFVPWLLDQVARTGSRELFTLAVLAAALGIAYGSAQLFGVSLALGAFFAGVVLSESDLSHQAAADSLPFRDAFAVLFFVSVGMLFDPSILVQEPLRILAVLLVIVVVKSLAAVAVVWVFRYPAAITLAVAAGLAQIGEFSFILAGLGVALGLLPPEGRDLILAGALLSITLNPLAFTAAGRMAGWLRARPALLARLEPSGDPLLSARVGPGAPRWRDHAVIVGYGRVGGPIGRALKHQGLPYVIIERNRRRVEELRGRGLAVIWGDAAAPGVLEAADVEHARLLVIAAPGGFQARRILELARRVNPRIDAVVRAHADGEVAYLERQGVGMVVMGERELALSMMGYALRSLGLPEAKARLVVQNFRASSEASDRKTEPVQGQPAPELRPHRDRGDAADRYDGAGAPDERTR